MTKLNTADVAKKLGISGSRVIQLVHEGKLETITKRKRGQQRHGRYEFDSVDVELYMAKKNGADKPPKLPRLPKLPKNSGIKFQLQEAVKALNNIIEKL